MNEGQIKSSTERTRMLLKELGLYKNHSNPSGKKQFISDVESLRNAYDYYTENFCYSFLLEDDGLILINYDLTERIDLTFSYIGRPTKFVSYEEYLAGFGWTLSDVGELFLSEWEQALSEQEQKNAQLYIRYDLSTHLYKRGLHPVSHLHIGIENEVRIPSAVIFSPLMFMCFIVKQVYPQKWKKVLEDANLQENYFHQCKSGCGRVENEFFDDFDQLELFLG